MSNKKYNCYNYNDFVHEWNRRAEMQKDKVDAEAAFSMGFEYMEATIKSLQKWSDMHPEETRYEKLIRILKENDFPLSDPLDQAGYYKCNEDGTNIIELYCDKFKNCDECKKYWQI